MIITPMNKKPNIRGGPPPAEYVKLMNLKAYLDYLRKLLRCKRKSNHRNEEYYQGYWLYSDIGTNLLRKSKLSSVYLRLHQFQLTHQDQLQWSNCFENIWIVQRPLLLYTQNKTLHVKRISREGLIPHQICSFVSNYHYGRKTEIIYYG